MSDAAAACEVALRCGNILGETPVWSLREQALYWVDVRAPAVHRLDPASGRHRSWPLPEICGGLALARHGLVLGLRRSLAWFDPASGAVTPWVEIEPASMENRLNEMRCDRWGRLWLGSMRDYGAAVTGSLYRVSAKATVVRILTDIRVPNGLGWSPDGRRLYFLDSGEAAMRAYDFEPETAALGSMHVLLAADALPGKPDGCAIDAEGFIWSARYGGGLIARIAPDGRIDRTHRLPVSQPTSCAFGGSDLKTLYITTAKQRLSDAALAEEPDAGALLAIRVAIPGLPEPEFAREA
jgi:sugar lactone lactonase YvrE